VNQRRPPQQLRAKLTRQHLLDAARRVFGEGGYAGATVDDVARAAGCSKGAYYFHFATKEDALLALAEDWSTAQTHRLELALERDGAPDTALHVLEALFAVGGATARDRLLILELWLQGARNPNVRAILDRGLSAWRRILALAFSRAQEAAPQAAAALALALYHGLLMQASLDSANSAALRERAAAALALFTRPQALRRTA